MMEVRGSVALVAVMMVAGLARAQVLTLERGNAQDRTGVATVVIEPYAPNIVHVTLSLDKKYATEGPGVGFIAKPETEGWTASTDAQGDHLNSSRMLVTVGPQGKPGPQPETAKFFGGSTPYVGISIKTPDGKDLLRMQGWEMAIPNYKDGNHDVLYDRRPTDDPYYEVGANFASPKDEHYYGLGQNQEGFLDRRGHVLHCEHDYNAPSGQSVCVPFVVTNKGYGIVWDNPSKTQVAFGFNDSVNWKSQVGQRVSFFVIAGNTYDEIYEGYRKLTGTTRMLPKSAYGYIQCKQRYSSQAELMAVAKGYRDRHLPIDDLVVDWFHYTIMGQMDMDPAKWPDPVAMNKQLHAMGFHTMISVWPRFVPEDRYFDFIQQHGWFMHLKDGTPTNGLPYDRAGSDIDSTNPDARKWYWSVIKESYVKMGFDSFWADETEPDIVPADSYFQIGPGTEYFNVYPFFHTEAFYDGMRKDMPERALILARDSYLGAQRNGTIFWSSDISGNWDTLKRQVPTGINFVASGMPYWSTDIGGWQGLPYFHQPERPVLIDPSDARAEVNRYDDYPELYVRWFEYGAFQPNFRTHGTRPENEVWSYGKQAEPILEKYLRLRYQLMPYLYSLGHFSNVTGAPFMRGLFMDFGTGPNADPKVANIGDEYMFGPALLVAPVTDQGMTTRQVYLPAGTDWYNYWTNERIHGGQTITVDAPIDTIPLFVKAGSILPLGTPVESTNDVQKIAKLKVYPGADGDFDLYTDDGTTYAYEQGKFAISKLHWSDADGKLTHTGAPVGFASGADTVEVVK